MSNPAGVRNNNSRGSNRGSSSQSILGLLNNSNSKSTSNSLSSKGNNSSSPSRLNNSLESDSRLWPVQWLPQRPSVPASNNNNSLNDSLHHHQS